MVKDRRILLAVTGGIAAFKAVYLARRLVERGADLEVIMTESALRFVGEQTFAAVAGKPVNIDLFGTDRVSPHTELGRWAELIVVAPATAASLAKLAAGLSDDLLSATLLATAAPVLLAPAMHTEMWEHPATQRNVTQLIQDGHRLIGPTVGSLAGGDEGAGRMVEPDEVVEAIEAAFAGPLTGWRVLISAGGTREPIDPVRYVGNRSSGKMGYAIAESAVARGAEVLLVTSSHLPLPAGVESFPVETAEEMADQVWRLAPTVDVAVLAAAVADFRPVAQLDSKLRRAEGIPELILEPTPDILAGVTQLSKRPLVVGFAAETGSLEGARRKVTDKGVDLLVANNVSEEGSGFGTDTNRVTIMRPDGSTDEWPLLGKRQVADRLWDLVLQIRRA
ncbi:MAG: bifunctional phosphopantothenoylcysteine decarboxylase/phosphopantothenate--cysteine ligase CoaBC [Acidimicrobiia bacterium]|nr:bifunctional phosphopantothenoylcysteine decarboxylase/phosphopantothenate--cysteine ligase CoaBC [Acidimicrobiia bacterium]